MHYDPAISEFVVYDLAALLDNLRRTIDSHLAINGKTLPYLYSHPTTRRASLAWLV